MKVQLREEFDMKDLGTAKKIFRIKIFRDMKGYQIILKLEMLY